MILDSVPWSPEPLNHVILDELSQNSVTLASNLDQLSRHLKQRQLERLVRGDGH